MKKTLLFLTLFTASLYSSAQQPFSYDWHEASNTTDFVALDVEVLNDTVYTLYQIFSLTNSDSIDANLVTNEEDWIYTSSTNFTSVVVITKQTTNGDYIESFKILENTDQQITASRFLLTEFGKIIVIGDGKGITTDFNPEGGFAGSYTATAPSDRYSFVAFYDLNGGYQGHFEYVINPPNNTVNFQNGIVDENNNLYLAGYFQGTADFNFTAGSDIHTSNGSIDGFVMKMNIVNQSYEWTKTIGGASSDYVNYIDYNNGKLLINGGFKGTSIDLDPSVASYNVNNGSFLGNDENQYATIWDTNGVFQSGLSLISSIDNESGGASFDVDGNVYMIGVYYSPDTVNVNSNGVATYLDTTLVNNWDNTYYILKYNSNLELIWHQSIIDSGQSMQLESQGDKSSIKNAGDYMLVNYSRLNGNLIQRINGGEIDTVLSVNNDSGLLIALNKTTGVFEYLEVYEGSNGNTDILLFHETFALSNGDFYAIGRFYRTMDFNNYDNSVVLDSAYGNWESSPFILKLKFNGFVGVEEIENETIQTIVYPNPTNNTINIQSNVMIQQISIIDINGRVVLNQNVNSKTISNINVSQLNNGIYFIKVIDEKRNSSINKIIKQ